MVDMGAWGEYYSNQQNLYKIANQCKYREVVVIRNVMDRKITLRPLKIFKLDHLQFWVERLKLTETLFDIYISNASVRLPPLPGDMHKLADSRTYLNEHWNELVTGYDIFADIDIGEESHRKKAREFATLLAIELKKQEYKNIELWDTSRGFHLVIKGRFSPDFVKAVIMDICCDLQIPMSMPIKEKDGKRYIAKNRRWKEMKADAKTPAVDKPNVDTSIYDYRRIRRVPFSLHSKTGKSMEKVDII